MEPKKRYELERKYVKEQRKEYILEAAGELFAIKGIEATTMQDIANETSLGVATIFRFFPQKDKIIIEVATRELQQILEAFREVEAQDISCIEKIEKIIDQFDQKLDSEEIDSIKILEDFDNYVSRSSELSEDLDQFYKVYREVSDVFGKIIKQGQADGSNRSDINVYDTLTTLVSTVGLFARKLSIQSTFLLVHLDLEPKKQLKVLKKVILDYLKNPSS